MRAAADRACQPTRYFGEKSRVCGAPRKGSRTEGPPLSSRTTPRGARSPPPYCLELECCCCSDCRRIRTFTLYFGTISDGLEGLILLPGHRRGGSVSCGRHVEPLGERAISSRARDGGEHSGGHELDDARRNS